MGIYVLIVIMKMSNASYNDVDGSTISFHEFNSLAKCNYAAGIIKKEKTTKLAFCVEK